MAKIHDCDEGQHAYWFFCPGCQSHHVFVTPMWDFNGDLEKPTVGGSILSNANRDCPDLPRCHSFIKDGKIQFLADCTHSLAGQTVELPDWNETKPASDETK